jgi:hypothetical protein
MSGHIITLAEVARELMAAADQAVKEKYSESIGSLYSHDGKQNPFHCGTCTFFRHSKGLFLVSAQHVFDYVDYTDFYILTEDELHPLQLEVQQTIGAGANTPDMLDLLVAHLNDRHRLWSDKFVAIDIDEACNAAQGLQKNTAVMALFGFPHSRNKPHRHHKRIPSQPFLISSSKRYESDLHAKCLFSDATHVFTQHAKYTRDHATGQTKMTVKPKGVSGGLMFDMGIVGKITEIAKGPSRPPIPVAIVTDAIPERQIIAGARLAIVKKIIERYPV